MNDDMFVLFVALIIITCDQLCFRGVCSHDEMLIILQVTFGLMSQKTCELLLKLLFSLSTETALLAVVYKYKNSLVYRLKMSIYS